MARPKKTPVASTAPVSPDYTTEQGGNGKWLVKFKGKPVRVFNNEAEAKKYVDYMVERGK